jgi:hypothetical protein
MTTRIMFKISSEMVFRVASDNFKFKVNAD